MLKALEDQGALEVEGSTLSSRIVEQICIQVLSDWLGCLCKDCQAPVTLPVSLCSHTCTLETCTLETVASSS